MMTNVLKRMGKEEKGLTLIELLAVIVILGIIAAIAVPMIGNIIGDTKKDADVATARQIYEAARLYTIGKNKGDISGTVSLKNLQDEGYIDKKLVLPSTKKEITAATIDFSNDTTTVVLSVDSKTHSFSLQMIQEGSGTPVIK